MPGPRGHKRPIYAPKNPEEGKTMKETLIKVSELKKDRQDTIRINSKVKEFLKSKGFSVQDLLDYAIESKVKVETGLKLK